MDNINQVQKDLEMQVYLDNIRLFNKQEEITYLLDKADKLLWIK